MMIMMVNVRSLWSNTSGFVAYCFALQKEWRQQVGAYHAPQWQVRLLRAIDLLLSTCLGQLLSLPLAGSLQPSTGREADVCCQTFLRG